MRFTEDLTCMSIEGQGNSRLDDRGFAMVVLLVVIAVLGVGMAAMLPTWRQQALREKEEELIFRGNQYARALVLYSRKNNNLLPTSVDLLYDGKYLRKKWNDPITGEEFGLLPVGQPAGAQGATPGAASAPGATQGGRGGGATPQGGRGTGPGSSFGQQVIGQIQGVYSTSTDTSIRVYQNQQRYIDWQFTVQTAQLLMGQGRAGGAGLPGRGGGTGPGLGGTGNPGGTGVGGGGRGVPGGGRGGQPAGPGRGVQPGQGGRGGQAPPTLPGRGGRGGQ
jgi:type II secretory pathway pseudopilin PulG